MKVHYNNALQIMLNCDEELAEKIKEFLQRMPENFAKKIEDGKKNGKVVNDGKKWEVNDTGALLNISVVSEKNCGRDYCDLMLSNISIENMNSWPRFEGEKLVGYFRVYLHSANNRSKAIPVTYNFYAKRIDKKVYVTIRTRVNSSIKENEERLEAYGLNELHKRVVSGVYEVDTKKIVENNIKR